MTDVTLVPDVKEPKKFKNDKLFKLAFLNPDQAKKLMKLRYNDADLTAALAVALDIANPHLNDDQIEDIMVETYQLLREQVESGDYQAILTESFDAAVQGNDSDSN